MRRYFALLLFIFLSAGKSFAEPQTPIVAILDSHLTRQFQSNPAYYSWEMEGAFKTLQELHVSYSVLQDADLTTDRLLSYKILILPGTKNIARAHAEAIQKFSAQGGKIFALGFASYRDEKDQPAGLQNNFQLADLFGADYLRYSPYPPQWGFLKLKNDLGDSDINLGRNTTVQIHPRPEARVLAVWLNDDETTTSAPQGLDSAIVESPHAIYSGENLFAPENSNSYAVRKLIADLLNRLAPGVAQIPENHFLGFPKLPDFGDLTAIKAPGPTIRVGLPFEVENGQITSDGPFAMLRSGRGGISAKKNWTIAFHAAEDGFEVAGKTGKWFLFTPRDVTHPLKIVLWHGDGTPASSYKFASFRGNLLLTEVGGKKMLINELPLEAYLPGVVSHEVPFYFHDAALQAMAVVARTFALREIKMKKFRGYDICATVSCQTYEGLQAESPSAIRAVTETAASVVTYHGALADLPYAATCGGVTEDIDKAWNVPPVPYLISVVDGEQPITEDLSADSGVDAFLTRPSDSFCKLSSRFRWKETYSAAELEGLFKVSLPVLLKHPVSFKRIVDISVSGRTSRGRVTFLKIVTDRETLNIGKDQIRWLFSGGEVGLGGLQSTLFVLQKKKTPAAGVISVTFMGGGWGHGVGLCQFGAEGMAQRGYTWRQILAHYYPGTTLTELKR